ncbi:MAG: hypothetical protein JWP44_5034 [Mucilaginibacter sp.]|nr:hypothetical protein [Mucilaginibacter sp.]
MKYLTVLSIILMLIACSSSINSTGLQYAQKICEPNGGIKDIAPWGFMLVNRAHFNVTCNNDVNYSNEYTTDKTNEVLEKMK